MDVNWITQATITQLQDAMEKGGLTSFQVCRAYFKQIAAHDKQGASINAIIEINPDALDIAAALDLERREKGSRGPMHGIPVIIKDNINTKDKMHTSAGSLALADSYAPWDAFVVTKLRQAGAVILGKANLTEWANFMAQGMPNGFSSRGGQVLNPYGPGKLDTGGSSAGIGAGTAAGFAVAGIGTETSGSILSPSSSNSLVGIKPTVGLVSRSGIIPISHSQDTAGPMARTVADAAYLLGAITGVDNEDPATLVASQGMEESYTQFLNPKGLEGARIGVCKDPYWNWLNDAQRSIMDAAVKAMADAGATIVDSVVIPSSKEKWDYNVLFHEFKAGINAYLATLNTNRVQVQTLADIVEFNKANATKALKFGQALLLQSEKTPGTLAHHDYLASREKDLSLSREGGIDAVLEEHNLNALLFPANFGASIPAKAGYPSITVPGGYTAQGEPLGVTFSGTAFSEPILLALAYSYEQATLHRRAPKL